MRYARISRFCAALLLSLVWGVTIYNTVQAQVMSEDLYKDFLWRNIGPANMSGRISDIEALDSDFTHVIVATASGGVYKSVNAGTTWEPIFDDYGTASIGDVAVFQNNPDIIWVGTGEECGRNSVGWGNGIYKSVDGGKTFTNMGLEDTHVIAKVLTHPTNPDIVYVGAAGHLWGYTGDRGLYKTTDGGKTWRKLTNGLPDDGRTGISDLAMDPNNPNILYAGLWQRLRQPFRFDSGGPGGGIFKSTNGGSSWEKLSRGLPQGDTGKIGIAIYRSNPDILMAMVEADGSDDLGTPGSGVYRSENGGESWKFVNTSNSRPFYYSHIFINPTDDRIVYMMSSRFSISYDGGTTFENQSTRTHGDYHAFWVDPSYPNRFYFGNDGGVALTQDHGETYVFYDNLVAGQFYAAGVDMRDPYWVYGGLQDNGTWGGPSKVRDPNGILTDHWIKIGGGDGFHVQIDPTDWRTVYFESQRGRISRHNPETGESKRIVPNRETIINYDEYIVDPPQVQQPPQTPSQGGLRRGPVRFNWSAPIIMSPHNPGTLYFGGNHLLKSVDKGDNWLIISPDLTTNDHVKAYPENNGGLSREGSGAENYCTIITISESPLTPGLVWVGTDDGNVQLTRNGGLSWSNVGNNIPGIPDNLWVSRVEASHFDEGTAYVSLEGHRSDNFTPWIFKTTDFGMNWENISTNIPDGQPVYVVREDHKNPNLLFAGTEFACFVSINGGKSWDRLMNNMPTVAVHDLVIHPRDGDLIAATHGRGIFILDDITPLQQLTAETLDSDAVLFDQRVFTKWERIQKSDPRKGYQFFSGDNYDATSAPISYYLKKIPSGDVRLEISDLRGRTHTAILDNEPGVNRYMWDMKFDPPPMTDRQIQQAIDRILLSIEAADEETQKQRLQKALQEYQNAPSDLHRRKAVRGLELVPLQGGRGGGSDGGNAFAGYGAYLLKMTVDGKTYRSSIIIREDPIHSGK